MPERGNYTEYLILGMSGIIPYLLAKNDIKVYFLLQMHTFEYDNKKSRSNLEKHGIDFIDAQLIWDDPDFIEIQANSNDEPRSLVIGCIAEKCWSAVITNRNKNIRIISVRRTRKLEVALYES